MKITQHGSIKRPFFKGVTTINNVTLVFFGYSMGEVSRKEQEWIEQHREELNQQASGRPALRLVRGGMA